MPLPFAPDSVLVDAADFWPVSAPGQLDIATQLVRDEDIQYRLAWELTYHTGKITRQYTRCGDQIFQVLFGKLPQEAREGVKRISVFDFKRKRRCGPVTILGVPTGATIDIAQSCAFTLNPTGVAVIHRVHSFGWKEANGKTFYLHINPELWPFKQWVSSKRLV